MENLCEKSIYSRIYSFLCKNKLINTNPFGFRSKHSTEHGLISLITSPWELMDPRTKNDSDKIQDIRLPFDPFDPLTAHKIDILIKQLLCQFEGLLVF